MKKIFLLLTFFIVAATGWTGTPNKIAGVCTYPWYGAGGHQGGTSKPFTIQGYDLLNSAGKWISTVRALPKFKHRMFVDSWIIIPETTSVNQTFTLKTEPTKWGNFYYDSYFALQKANGIENILCISGCMKWYDLGIQPNGKPYSQRKSACYDPTMSPSDKNAWKDLAHLCKLTAAHYKDKGLVDYIQILNEWDFRWNVRRIITPQEYAVAFYVCYNAIQEVAPNQKIMSGASLTPTLAQAKLFLQSLDSICAINGKPKIRGFTLTSNLYIRTNSLNQGSGIAETLEKANIYDSYFYPLNEFCKVEGLTFSITETGYSSSPSNSAAAMKNKAPALEGYSLEEAQGVLNLRIVIPLATLSQCVGVYFYHCKDCYEAEPFTYHGLCYDKSCGGKESWTAKPARTILEEFLETYGNYDFSNYRKQGNYYAVDLRLTQPDAVDFLVSAETSLTLVWTDRVGSGMYDAMPRVGQLQLPNQSPVLTVTSPVNGASFTEPATVTLAATASDNDGYVASVKFFQNGTLLFTDTQYPYTFVVSNLSTGTYTFGVHATDNNGLTTQINNIAVIVNAATNTNAYLTPPLNHQLKWSDGTPVKIVGHNSPENILHWRNYAFLDWLYAHGANCLYASVNNKESGKPQFSLWINNSPAQGFDEAKTVACVDYVQYWLSKNPKNIIQFVLSEKETHDLYSVAQHKQLLDYMAVKFAAFNGRIITNREEVPNGWSKLDQLIDYQKQVAPSWLVAVHCNTNQNPWSGNYNTNRIHILSMQDNVSSFASHINNEAPKNAHWVAIASEVTGGFQPNDIAKAETLWNAGGTYNVGVEVYIACCDQTNPGTNWYLPYAPVFDKLKQLAGGVTPPPTPTTYPLFYSTTSIITTGVALQGATMNAGKIWVYINVNADIPNRPLNLYYDNTFINNENGRPYELGGGNGQNVTNGTHTVRVTNAQNVEISTATFTVGGIVLPPDTIVIPPDTIPQGTFIVEYSKSFNLLQPVTVSGATATILQNSYWWFVRAGVAPFTFDLTKNGTRVSGYPKQDNAPVFYFNGNGNVYFQRGQFYVLTITDGTGAQRRIEIRVVLS